MQRDTTALRFPRFHVAQEMPETKQQEGGLPPVDEEKEKPAATHSSVPIASLWT